MKVLVIEDEHHVAQIIKQGLEREAYAVDISFDGEDGYLAATAGKDDYAIILLDITVPNMDGAAICRQLRADGVHTPVLLLTPKDHEPTVVRGLEAGADDYLPKPFSFEILLARMRALVRHPVAGNRARVLRVHDLVLNSSSRTVERAGRPIHLSTKEYDILAYLLRNKGRLVSKQSIMSHVWDFEADVMPNNVEVFMTYLRAKIDKPFDGPPLLRTVRGFGYIIDAGDAAST